jgi:hypothetical protein
MVGPGESVPVELNIIPTTADTGVMYVHETVCHPDIEPCTHCEDTCGDCYGWTGGCAFVVIPLPVGAEEGETRPVTGQIGPLNVVPNPFTGSTDISFSVAGRTEADVTVYDPSGRSVRTLHNGVLETGRVTLTWDGRDGSGRLANPGHYFVLVELTNRSVAKKILLLR